jgi:predicted ATPase
MLLRNVQLINLLSFKDAKLSLEPLNVVIGPNGSGKSNLISAIALLRSAPSDLAQVIAKGGGIREWIWRGPGNGRADISSLTCDIEVNLPEREHLLTRYRLALQEHGQAFSILKEELQPISATGYHKEFFDREAGKVVFGARIAEETDELPEIGRIHPSQSVFSQFRDPIELPHLTAIGKRLDSIRVYRGFNTGEGPEAGARFGVSTNYPPTDVLAEGGFNLSLVLNNMDVHRRLKRINADLTELCDRFEEIKVDVSGGIAKAYLYERNLNGRTSGSRMSDGTLKFLCLLAVLYNAAPDDALVCIEEPEIGLHPDAVRLVARALRDASSRMQIIVTTHSDVLVDELSDIPESVVVCDNEAESGSRFERMSRHRLDGWLDRYSLGEIWRRGEMGGNRW